MKRKRLWLGLAVLLVLPIAGSAADRQNRGDKVLEFDTMAAVVRPFVGAANPIRGVAGGGIPWVLREAKGELSLDGRVEVKVRGLVLAEGTRAGTNPIPQFRAIVSCLTPAADGAGNLTVATVNRATSLFPATLSGDADIEDIVSLPSPCIAPIAFVTSPTGAWFSATGV